MKLFIVLLCALITMCTAAYGQTEEGVSQSTAFNFDQDKVSNRLASLKPFKPENGEYEQEVSSFLVTQEEFRNSLILLIKEQEKVDDVMAHFGTAVVFVFNNGSQLLTLTQWSDTESTQAFMTLRYELWRLMDREYKQFIKKVDYEEIDITKDEKALLTRKTIQQDKQKQDVTTLISARERYFFECTLIGGYSDREVKKLILQIWDIFESEVKKGAR